MLVLRDNWAIIEWFLAPGGSLVLAWTYWRYCLHSPVWHSILRLLTLATLVVDSTTVGKAAVITRLRDTVSIDVVEEGADLEQSRFSDRLESTGNEESPRLHCQSLSRMEHVSIKSLGGPRSLYHPPFHLKWNHGFKER